MEKQHTFRDAMKSALGFNPYGLSNTNAVKKIKGFFSEGKTYEAIILSVSLLDTNEWSKEVADELAHGIDIPLDKNELDNLRWEKSYDFIEKMISEEKDLKKIRNVLMKFFIVRPYSVTTNTLLLAYDNLLKFSEEKCVIAESLMRFFVYNPKCIEIVFQCFRLFNEYGQESQKEYFLKQTICRLKEMEAKEMLLSLYWYYSYIEEVYVKELLLDSLLDFGFSERDFNFSFFKNFSWPTYPLDQLRGQYENIVADRSNNSSVKFSTRLTSKKFESIIPLCMYAKAMGDIQTEADLLWLAFSKKPTSNILVRLKEITSYDLPENYKKIFMMKNGQLDSIIKGSVRRCFSRKTMQRSDVEECKIVYSIKPFHADVISGLICIYSMSNDKEVLGMIKRSVTRMNTPLNLWKILTSVLVAGDLSLFRVVTEQLIALGKKHSSVASDKFIYFLLGKYRQLHKYSSQNDYTIVVEGIACYEKCLDNSRDKINSRIIKEGCEKLKIAPLVISNRKLSVSEKNGQVSDWFENREYQKIVTLCKSTTLLPFKVLELGLLSSIRIGKSSTVIEMYQRLLTIDKARAITYTVEVAPFIKIYNKINNSKGGSSKGLVSSIWDTSVLENPINQLARQNK